MRETVAQRLLEVPGGLAAAPLRRFLLAHVVPTGSGPVQVSVDLGAGPRCETVALTAPADVLDEVEAVVRRWLDLDADHVSADAWLATDPLLAPLVAARPGLRFPHAVDGAESAVLTVLGQQVSLAAACTFAGRLVAAYGTPVETLVAFPGPAALAAAGPEEIRAVTGITRARARTVHALATALADGLDLDAAVGDPLRAAAARAELLALPGIGPWTADYVALRVLGDADAFLSGDLVLRRALGGTSAKEATARAEPWRPWRGHALLHLWTAEVFAS